MPRTCTICYNEAEYAGKIKAKTVNVVLDKAERMESQQVKIFNDYSGIGGGYIPRAFRSETDCAANLLCGLYF